MKKHTITEGKKDAKKATILNMESGDFFNFTVENSESLCGGKIVIKMIDKICVSKYHDYYSVSILTESLGDVVDDSSQNFDDSLAVWGCLRLLLSI